MDKMQALNNLIKGTASEKEIDFLMQGLASGEISINGNVQHSIIILGNNNQLSLSPETSELLNAKAFLPKSGKIGEDEFWKVTKNDLRNVRLNIPGIVDSIRRTEIGPIEDQLNLGRSVIITGEPGTGKSGLGAVIARSGIEKMKTVLFVDARRLTSCHSEADLSNYFRLDFSFSEALINIGKLKGFRLVIDQFDSVIGQAIADVLAEVACNIGSSEGVEVVIITRKKEGHEQDGLNFLSNNGFVEIESHPLSPDEARSILEKLDISITDELVQMSSNLLNLELVGEIKQNNPIFNFENLLNDVDLWEKFVDTVRTRETRVVNAHDADLIIAEAIRLARQGLVQPDREFPLESPTKEQQRIVSWDIISRVDEGYQYRFKHELLQDFLYAKHAVSHNWLTKEVLSEIPKHRTANIFRWMQSLYGRKKSPKRIELLKEMLNVGQ